MGFIDRIARRLGYVRAGGRAHGFAAAEVSRLTSSLATEAQFINTTLRYQGRILRARSRQAAQNNPYARRFVQMVIDNVCGPLPFRLQAKVKYRNGKLDTGANAAIEEAWLAWGHKGNCELSGKWSWNALQRMLVRTLAVDGELLLRKYKGPEYGRHGFMVQPIDIDRLDDLKNESLRGGGAIHQGIELDAVGRPVAYHILRRKPAHWQMGYTPRESERVPAEDVAHVFIPEFAEQARGVPWIYAALLNLVHLGAFEEAAVIAARIGAAQMGFILTEGDDTFTADGKTADGTPVIDVEPGTFRKLGPGQTVEGWNPKYPDAAIEPFINSCLRGIAAGLNVANHNLSGNMEGVNYSSARIAELDERDGWMTIQNFVCEHLHQPEIYEPWLKLQVLTGVLPFDLARLDKYRTVYWQARRWAWVDPAKEVKAAIEANNHRLKSRTRIIAEGGEDIEDVFDEIASEAQLAKDKKIELPSAAPAAPAAPTNPDATDTGEPDDEKDD